MERTLRIVLIVLATVVGMSFTGLMVLGLSRVVPEPKQHAFSTATASPTRTPSASSSPTTVAPTQQATQASAPTVTEPPAPTANDFRNATIEVPKGCHDYGTLDEGDGPVSFTNGQYLSQGDYIGPHIIQEQYFPISLSGRNATAVVMLCTTGGSAVSEMIAIYGAGPVLIDYIDPMTPRDYRTELSVPIANAKLNSLKVDNEVISAEYSGRVYVDFDETFIGQENADDVMSDISVTYRWNGAIFEIADVDYH